MDFEKIKELIKLVDSSSLAFFELQSGNDHIKMDKSLNRGITDGTVGNSNTINKSISPVVPVVNVPSSVEKTEEVKSTEKEVVLDDANTNIIKSPMVGTFYSSASPESSPFVEVGGSVSKGKVICIIEAMKLMNEIESEYNGIIVERLVNDGDMVEYGQPLFKVKGE